MPALSAHDQFGIQIYSKMPTALKVAAKKNIRLFRLGFQGPDLLFYHQPLKKSEIAAKGMLLHSQSGKQLFAGLCAQLQEKPDEELLAYALGLCCHYALDRTCHPYVNEWAACDGKRHKWLETNFDVFIRQRYHRVEPRYLNLPVRVNVEVPALAFGITSGQAASCVRSFRFFTRVLDWNSAVQTAERVLGKEDEYSTLSLPKDNHLPEETMALYALWEQALPLCVQLVQKVYVGAQEKGTDFEDFEENFEGVLL